MLEITEMRIDDYAEILSFWTQVAELGVSPEFDTRERIATYLQRNPGFSTVAKYEGKVIGTVLCGHDGRRGSIYHVGVANEFRGQGIATKMLERSTSLLRAAGIHTGFLFVHVKNPKAAEFWTSEGWQYSPDIMYFYKSF